MALARTADLRPHPRNSAIYGAPDVRELVEQIAQSGWIKPLVVTPANVIVSGHRRWLAAQQLGLAEVPVEVRAFDSPEAETEALLLENAYRDKTPEQRAREAELWLEIERTRAEQRRLAQLKQFRSEVQNVAPREEGKARDLIAKRVGFGSGWQYEKAAAVVRVADELRAEGEETRAKSLLDTLNKKSVHAAYQQVRSLVETPKPEPATILLPADAPRLEVADATALPLDDGCVDLIVTSPPYGLDKPYRATDDPAEGWVEFMADWLAEAYRVSREGGRLALNVPLDTTQGGFRPTYAQAIAAALDAGWRYRSTIVWHEGNVSKSTGRGSVDSAAAPHVIAPVEMIALFCKGDWKRDATGRLSDIGHQDWLDWTSGFWAFGGESRPWEGHPAPFPEELPRRLIHLLSFVGDTVLDPFVGSGTTALVAWRLGRRAIGFDLSEEYIAAACRRIAAATTERVA